MRKKQEDAPAAGSPAWMATYGDLVTLLLTFFVMLFAMSTVDVAKYKAFVGSFEGSTGVLDGQPEIYNQDLLGNGMTQYPPMGNKLVSITDDLEKQQYKNKQLEAMTQEIKEHLEKENLEQKVEVQLTQEYISIKFDDILLFDTGKANLKPGAIPVLDKVGVQLAKYLENPSLHLRFEGHTDNIPIKTSQFPSNWELSAARAIAVAKFYIEEMSFNPKQISTEGFGEHMPVVSNDTPEGRSENRRVEIKIVASPNK